jgi:hypothetical protein
MMIHKLTDRQRDALMRVLWTTLQVALPFATVELTHLPVAYVPLGTVVLAVLKNLVTAHLGSGQAGSKDPS